VSPAVGDTIFALSSGAPPAAVALIRVSGPAAGNAIEALAGERPQPRRASLATLRDPGSNDVLDRALLLWFPEPGSATGEDLAEFHLHGGRSVVAGVQEVLASLPGLRPAEPGEFTRRAFENGRIDLSQAEGLADLLLAETQSQRRAALTLAGGGFSRKVEGWQKSLLAISAQIEAELDFSDEGDVTENAPRSWRYDLDALSHELAALLRQPPAERLRDGIRVVIAGPPNSGKSSLLNHLAGREAAITSAIAGTTRDLVEAPTAIGGTPFLLVDTAGLRESKDEIEAIGVERAKASLEAADLILWLGTPDACPDRGRAIIVESMADLRESADPAAEVSISCKTGAGMDLLVTLLGERSRLLLPQEGEVAINQRHKLVLKDCSGHLSASLVAQDPLIASEELRQARALLDRITGRAGVEDMLDTLFGSFCMGK